MDFLKDPPSEIELSWIDVKVHQETNTPFALSIFPVVWKVIKTFLLG